MLVELDTQYLHAAWNIDISDTSNLYTNSETLPSRPSLPAGRMVVRPVLSLLVSTVHQRCKACLPQLLLVDVEPGHVPCLGTFEAPAVEGLSRAYRMAFKSRHTHILSINNIQQFKTI